MDGNCFCALFSSGAGVFWVQTNLDFTYLTPTSKKHSVLIFECMQTAQHVMFPPLWEFHICFFTLIFCARAQTQKPPPAFPDQLLAPGIAQSDRFSILNMYYICKKTRMAITTDARRINISSVTRHPHVPNSTVFFHFPRAWVL